MSRGRRQGRIAGLAAAACLLMGAPPAPAQLPGLEELLPKAGAPKGPPVARCTGGEPSRAPVRPGAALPFGFNRNLDLGSDGSPMTLEEHSALEARAGATVTRMTLGWGLVERERGSYAWDVIDDRYCVALAHGLRPLFTILGSPAWAAKDGCPKHSWCLRPPAREYDDELERFARLAAQRYPRAMFEAWNEPNFEAFWGGPPDARRYTRVLRAIFRGVKAGNRYAPVAGGALMNAPWNSRPDERPAFERLDTFLASMYEEGAGAVMDAVSVHPYFFRKLDTPLSRFFMTFDGAPRFAGARAVMAAAGHGGEPIWATEVGIKPEPGAADDRWTTHDEAAGDFARGYEWLAAQSDVDVVIFHALLEHPCPPKRYLCDPDATPGHSWLRQVTDMFGRPVRGRFTARAPYCRFANAYGDGLDCDAEVPAAEGR